MSSVSELVPKRSPPSAFWCVCVCGGRASKKAKNCVAITSSRAAHKDTACKLEDETRAGRREGKYVKAAFDPTKATDERYHGRRHS